ncbi:hypothetical protein M8J75_014335 [Diaphorina citri]|nr:hypothetical protein M8J75_014335 [Diaphorina citri]
MMNLVSGLPLGTILLVLPAILTQDRSLLFPVGSSNRVQFLAGFGVSVPDLPEPESLTCGYIVKSYYVLPDNTTYFYEPYVIYQRSNQGPLISRTLVYQYVEYLLELFGLGGRDCLLKAICEFSRHHQTSGTPDLLSQILHVLLT